jgi:hypothetical protein
MSKEIIMKATKRISMLIIFLLIISVFLTACGTFVIGLESPENTLVVNEIKPGASSGVVETPQITQEIPTPTPTQEPTPEVDVSAYWTVVEDPRTGVRFAIPCFWEYEIPELDPSGLGSFSLRNYPYSYVNTFPRGAGVFEAGGIKIDVLYFEYASWDLPSGSLPVDLIQELYGEDNTESKLLSVEEVRFNFQPAWLVTTESIFGIGQLYLFDLSPEVAFGFGAAPEGIEQTSRDVMAIFNSVSLSLEVEVQIPQILPSPPPPGVEAPCLKGVEYPSDAGNLTGTLDCFTTDSTISILYVACNVQDGLRSGNTAALISWMGDPFIIGYWGSEGRSASPQDIIEELHRSRLPAETSSLAFTTDRSKFPPLAGMPPENMFGPDVDVAEIVYSEGWGQDGLGAALLYIAENENGDYYWHGMVFSGEHFDK